jgi:purine nucleoside permease
MPSDWTTGRFPLESKRPHDPNARAAEGQVFHLNPALVNWAYGLTRNIDLGDNPALQKSRARYVGYPNALKPPFVLKGDNIAGMTFWHGKLLNDWANEWVSQWTQGKGNFVTSAMEDSGTLVALGYLGRAGKVDNQRALVLRTGSNYTMPPPGRTAAENMASENEGYSGLSASVESAYKVGSTVVSELVKGWSTYRDHPPGSASPSAQ